MAQDARWGTAEYAQTTGIVMPWGTDDGSGGGTGGPAAPGDVVDVYNVATKVGAGPTLSPAFMKGGKHSRSNVRHSK